MNKIYIYIYMCLSLDLEANEQQPSDCVSKPSMAVTKLLDWPGQMKTQGAAWAAAADCNCNLSDGKWQIAPLIISNQLRQKTDIQACKHNYNDILGGRRTAMEHIWGFHEATADWLSRTGPGGTRVCFFSSLACVTV